MPYVSESDQAKQKSFPVGSSHVILPYGWTRQQTGYRSGPSHIEKVSRDLASKPLYKWGQVGRALSVIDDIGYEYSGGKRATGSVNARNFERLSYSPVGFTQSGWYTGPTGRDPVQYENTGALSWRPDLSLLPALPSDAKALAYASKTIRGIVPTAPEIDLIAFVGEQKDAPRMFKAANYVPRSRKELGSAYLNYVFGVSPSISDIQTIAETVVNAKPILKGYVNNERRSVRRSRSWTLSHEFGSQSGSFYYPSDSDVSWATPVGSVVLNGRAPRAITGYMTPTVCVNRTWSSHVRMKAFGTWMYFIPRPQGFMGRLNRYSKQAERLLGDGLSPSAVWEWTRYSWLVDWFVDIGGLLRYQQAVAGNQLVASRMGYSLIREMSGTASLSFRQDQQYRGAGGGTTVNASFDYFEHRRKAGGPYSLVQPWNLSGNQAAVVAAIGISR